MGAALATLAGQTPNTPQARNTANTVKNKNVSARISESNMQKIMNAVKQENPNLPNQDFQKIVETFMQKMQDYQRLEEAVDTERLELKTGIEKQRGELALKEQALAAAEKALEQTRQEFETQEKATILTKLQKNIESSLNADKSTRKLAIDAELKPLEEQITNLKAELTKVSEERVAAEIGRNAAISNRNVAKETLAQIQSNIKAAEAQQVNARSLAEGVNANVKSKQDLKVQLNAELAEKEQAAANKRASLNAELQKKEKEIREQMASLNTNLSIKQANIQKQKNALNTQRLEKEAELKRELAALEDSYAEKQQALLLKMREESSAALDKEYKEKMATVDLLKANAEKELSEARAALANERVKLEQDQKEALEAQKAEAAASVESIRQEMLTATQKEKNSLRGELAAAQQEAARIQKGLDAQVQESQAAQKALDTAKRQQGILEGLARNALAEKKKLERGRDFQAKVFSIIENWIGPLRSANILETVYVEKENDYKFQVMRNGVIPSENIIQYALLRWPHKKHLEAIGWTYQEEPMIEQDFYAIQPMSQRIQSRQKGGRVRSQRRRQKKLNRRLTRKA